MNMQVMLAKLKGDEEKKRVLHKLERLGRSLDSG